MDIVEHIKTKGTGEPNYPIVDISDKAESATHWWSENSPVCPNAGDFGGLGSGRVGSGLANGFHTYGLEWTPNYLKYYYDGIVVWTVNDSPTSPVSHTNEYILLCGEVPFSTQARSYGRVPSPGGFGPLGSSSNPKMTVDYVRVYQTPPPAVTDLAVPSVAKKNVAVSWTAPGDNGTGEQVAEYDLRWSSSPITASNFDSATRVTTSAPHMSGWKECRNIAWTTCGIKYFAIKSRDDWGNWSAISNVPSATPVCGGPNTLAECPEPEEDGGPPADVTDLEVTCIGNTTLNLGWTAPGDDGTTGTAAEYDFRYSTSTITASNFGSATRLRISVPSTAGSVDNAVVTDLSACHAYFFALKTRDEWGNWSGISNVTSGSTVCGNQLPTCDEGGGAAKRPIIPTDEVSRLFTPGANPARGATSFRISVPSRSQLRVGVYDVQGRQVRSLVNRIASPGPAQIDWNLLDNSGHRVASGLYMVRVDVGDTRKTFRLVVVR